MAHIIHHLAHTGGFHQIAPLLINDFALVIHDIVIAEQVFADVKVPGFNLFLGFFQGFANPRMGDGLILLKPEADQ